MEVDSYDNNNVNNNNNVEQQQQQTEDQQDGQQKDTLDQLLQGKKRVQKQKKKLTLDLLKGNNGFKQLLGNTSKRLQKEFKGPGHEAHDLRRLIEGYRRWQLNLFPECSFDEFIAQLERIGASNITKVELREMREAAVSAIDAAIDKNENNNNTDNNNNIYNNTDNSNTHNNNTDNNNTHYGIDNNDIHNNTDNNNIHINTDNNYNDNIHITAEDQQARNVSQDILNDVSMVENLQSNENQQGAGGDTLDDPMEDFEQIIQEQNIRDENEEEELFNELFG